ncbi:Gag-pol polyprotein [Abeliophyllum distichum]|uniref:Gag-pol polyprotein n=1 Tax=Abeliophyllum distichum TaxID=126358 RepID=A0ABD1PCT2_9LAMI
MASSSVQGTPDELELMKQRLTELEAKQKNTPEEYTTDRHSPFMDDILAKPLLEKLKMPHLTSYEDGNDAVGHLERYTSWMELQGASDAITCRAFPLTFGNRAMRWFKKLPQRSIRSWNDLSGLRTKTRFWWSVHEDRPATYQGFLARAEKYIGAEEATSDQENDRPDRKDSIKGKEKDLKTEKKESTKKTLEISTQVGQDPSHRGTKDIMS